jgi:hypothetical protein
MALVFGIAVLLIFVGFARALWGREASGDAPDEADGGEGVDTPPEDAQGDDASSEDPDRVSAPPKDAPSDGAPPEAPDRVSAPPWEAYPDAQWKLSGVKPATWKGGAPPSMMELFERVPENEPDAPVSGWVMPEPDPALMEDPEDYGIDNGDPDEPMWTPPEPPAAAPPEKPPRKWGVDIFGIACAARIVFDALYLLQYALVVGNNGKGFFPTRFKLDIPGGVETVVFAAGALLLMDALVLALFVCRSRWIKAAFLVYLLFDVGLRAINFMNGLLVGGGLLDSTLLGVALAACYDLVCALYVLRSGGTLEAPDQVD